MIKDTLLKWAKSPIFWVIIALAIGVGFGRLLAPSKVQIVEKEKIVEVEKKIYVKDETKKENKDKKKRTVIIRITKPDGTIEERTEIVEEDNSIIAIDTKEKSEEKKKTEKEKLKEKIVKNKKPDWMISALASSNMKDIKSLQPDYGISVQRRILGPVYLGAFGITNKQVGLSVGFQF
jgi:hypothetical protein